ncbi:hypothetical protein QTP70_031014, partial [Hemibagrus guttatus]
VSRGGVSGGGVRRGGVSVEEVRRGGVSGGGGASRRRVRWRSAPRRRVRWRRCVAAACPVEECAAAACPVEEVRRGGVSGGGGAPRRRVRWRRCVAAACPVEECAAAACPVEECAAAVAKLIGVKSIVTAARMNKSVVMFVDDVSKAEAVVLKGVVMKGTLVKVFPLSTPARRVILSNVPPFIDDEDLCTLLSRFGKVVSPVKMLPTGCKDPELRHIYSYRRQAFMILNNRDEDLNVIFKTKCDGGEYTIYATSGSLKCFGCAQEGHLVRNCPEEQAAGEQETGTVTENIQEREQGENKQDSGEDNTQTEDQEENKQQETTTESQEGRKDTETEVNHMESENEQSQGDMNKDTENSTQLANSQNTEECEGTDMTVDDSGFTAVRDQPKVSSEDNAALEGPLVLEELHAALSTMSGGKAPGVDSLPLELYKFLWKELGEDLLEVLEESRRERCLSLSSRRAVITLLPKKGDLQDIKNWRPVSLLCTDYKVMSKALANRLRDIMDFVIQTDQTYCVPNRSIIDNVSLIRDILDVSRSLVVDLGLISLDQEKAFDRVEHQYLWKTLEAFGLSPSLIAMIKVLYQDVESVLKINGGLSAPFKVQRGIRQGCSLSAWTLFKRGSQGPAVSLYWLLEEPLVGGGRMDIKDSSPGLAHITHSKRLVDTAGPEVKDTKEVEEEPEVTT